MLSITTDDVRATERFAFWQDAVCNVFTRVDCAPQTEGAVLGRIKATDAGVLRLCATECSPLDYRRDASHVRASPTDNFLVNLMLRGVGYIAQGGQTAIQREGDIVLFDTAKPYLLHYPEHVVKITVEVPRATLQSRVPKVDRMCAHTFRGSSPLVALAGSVLREVSRQDPIASESAARSMGGLIAEVIATAIQADFQDLSCSNTRQGALLDRLKCYLLDNLGDPDVNISKLAEVHCIGERTVNRLFAAEGTTAMRWLWNQRIAASYRALSEGASAQVTSVALECGFTNFSHFSRCFKKTYDVQPHVLARSARKQMPDPEVAARLARVSDRN